MFCLHSSCRDDNTIQFNCIMLVWKIYINSVYIVSWKRPWTMFCRLKQIGEMNHFCLKQVQCLKAFSNTPPTQTSYKGAIYVTLFAVFLTHSPPNRP